MVKSFKADLRQGGNTILDDVYVRGCLYISDGCGIIFQDKSNSDKQSRLIVIDDTLRLEPIGGGGGGGGSGGGGSDGVPRVGVIYDLSVPSSTTKIRLSGNDNTTDDIELVGDGGVTVSRTNANKITITGSGGGGGNTTYDLSVPNSTTKLRLAGSDNSNDDVEIVGSGSVSVTRTNANKLTISGTQLSTEAVQDIVGDMVSSNTETNISVTYDDTNGKLNFSSTDTNTQLSTEQVQDIVGGMVSGNTETNITVTYDDTNGKLNFAGAGSAGTPDKIEEGDTKAEVVDVGSNGSGHLVVNTEGSERLRVLSDGRIGIGTDDPNALGKVSIVSPVSGGHSAINIQYHSVGAGNTNIVLRSIDNNGGNWAGAEFRAENYSFKIRTTERFRFGFNGELGIGVPNSGPNYGIAGQVLKTQGVGAGVTWQTAGLLHSNKTSAYTLTASDDNRLITTTSDITVPSGIFSPANGTTIYNNSSSNITITQGSNVTLRLTGSNITGNRILAQRGVCTIMCVASNEFIITGSGLA